MCRHYAMPTLFMLCLMTLLHPLTAAPKTELDSILQVLDRTIEEKQTYIRQKEQRIADLCQLLRISNITPLQQYDINTKLYNEYKSFIPDSAIVFAQENIGIAERMGDRERTDDSKINLALLYAVAGMYIDADRLLCSVSSHQLPDWLRRKYYDSYKQLFYFYPENATSARNYEVYRDSLLACLEPGEDDHTIVLSEKLTHSGHHREARTLLMQMLDRAKDETHWRAVLAYAVGETYRMEGDYEQQKKYYAISAIADIRNVIKENASLRSLATAFYETGDVERAYKYVQQSMEDAVFSNARLRTMEVSQVFPIIEQSYQHKLSAQNERLSYLLVCIGLLSVFLIMAVAYVYVQLKRLARTRRSLSAANKQLHDLNKDLQSTNKALSEANLLKETYISQFLDMCSMYINKLEKYQNTLNKKAMERKLDELYRILKSRDMIENELKELFDIFDNIFLHLYPNFVEEFNALLLPEERFELKPGELLNPELRIFALIRLGITDSSKIAGFLHYSATTIYNYRTRVRNKSAVPREEFESRVMLIRQLM